MTILDHSNGEMNPYLTTKKNSNYYFMKIMAAILTSKCLLFNFFQQLRFRSIFDCLCIQYGLNDLLRGSKWWISTLFGDLNEHGMLSYGHSGSHFEKYAPSVDIFNLRGTGFCVLVNQ